MKVLSMNFWQRNEIIMRKSLFLFFLSFPLFLFFSFLFLSFPFFSFPSFPFLSFSIGDRIKILTKKINRSKFNLVREDCSMFDLDLQIAFLLPIFIMDFPANMNAAIQLMKVYLSFTFPFSLFPFFPFPFSLFLFLFLFLFPFPFFPFSLSPFPFPFPLSLLNYLTSFWKM